MEIKVLDKGFVRLDDMLGDDHTAVRSARVSYGKDLEIDNEKDKKLINHLLDCGHGSPFEHIVFTFHVKCPIFVARQWMRHRIGSFSEKSGRYAGYSGEYYIPEKIRMRDDVANGFKDVGESEIIKAMKDQSENSLLLYKQFLSQGVTKEMARIILPLNIYTEFYWTVNARSLMNFLNLRADSHAQWEMQEYARAVARFFEEKIPWTYEAFIGHSYKGNLLRGVKNEN